MWVAKGVIGLRPALWEGVPAASTSNSRSVMRITDLGPTSKVTLLNSFSPEVFRKIKCLLFHFPHPRCRRSGQTPAAWDRAGDAGRPCGGACGWNPQKGKGNAATSRRFLPVGPARALQAPADPHHLHLPVAADCAWTRSASRTKWVCREPAPGNLPRWGSNRFRGCSGRPRQSGRVAG